MIRTPRCLRKSAARARGKSRSAGSNRLPILPRPDITLARVIPTEIFYGNENSGNLESADETASFNARSTCSIEVPILRLKDGVVLQFENILEESSRGFSSSIPQMSRNGGPVSLLSLSPSSTLSARRLSTSIALHSPPNDQKKITLWSKVGPLVRPIPGKMKRGLANYTSDIDMSRYENWPMILSPVKRIIFTGLVFKKIGGDIVHGIKHLGSSLKLFWLNSKIGVKIAVRIMKGEQVSAIERNRMKRALADIFLMFPFSIFVIIPGAELLIPVYLKIFPSAMPSSFETLSQKEQRTIKQTQARLDLASFLHETLNEVQKKQKAATNATMTEFMKFTKEVRNGHRWITNQDIRRFAPIFQEHLTIEQMDRQTLDALCKIFKANPVKQRVSGAHGEFTQSTQLIRLVLRKRLHELKYQDIEWLEIIQDKKRGIKAIPVEDLQDLNRDRGMRAAGLTRERLERQYLDWLELAHDPVISDSLLAYTRILYMPKTLPKLTTAMEKSIDKKKPKRKEEIKVEEENVDPAPELIDTAPVDDERSKFRMKISLADVEAILESIKETKRLLKPLAATKDELLEGVQKNDRDLDDDRIELLNPAIVKQIEKLNFKAESTAARISTEPGDVAVEAKFLSKALAARGVTEYKIGKILRSMDQDGDGEISLDELEFFVTRIKEEISSDSAADCTKRNLHTDIGQAVSEPVESEQMIRATHILDILSKPSRNLEESSSIPSSDSTLTDSTNPPSENSQKTDNSPESRL
ncbi:Oidioi.mRNA.OKI2018_I69.chr1.g1913.t3.cds [Oikopleura dioica]|uniref:Mitochondrial proton/calcium exchanger protein n=1 Tax=Oikopleura dioica TaxID=34765 RepID=A0ABN7SYK6_OIKDI|nr:Oidioi.mRNA.OKI2018_I69.chr1.g1913.t3.cds [Oikopleura dioica]